MINRKQIELDRFKEEIDRVWSLSLIEKEVLESFLELFLAGKNTEIKRVEHLLNDEIEELLELLNDREVINYVTENWDFISPEDESDLVDALDNLNFDWSSKITDADMINSLEEDGWSVKYDYKYPKHQGDIVTQSDLEEMTELFLNLSQQKRNEMINKMLK